MRGWIQTALFGLVAGVALLVATPAQAQRTGDHIVPSIETACDDDPYSFGLCNAYCEALDCHCPTPGTPECTALGTPRACANLLRNYMKKSGGAAPPCGCPCGFNVQADFNELVLLGEAEIGVTIDVAGTFQSYCGIHGPNGEETFVADATEGGPNPPDTPQGVRLFYWIEPAVGDVAATCNEEGGGFDEYDEEPLVDGWSYGPFISRQEELDVTEVGACQAALDFLCSQ